MAITHSLRYNDFTEKLTKWLVGNLKFLNKKTAVMATQVCARGKGRQRSKKLFPLKFMFLQKNRNNLCGIKKNSYICTENMRRYLRGNGVFLFN